MKKRLKMSKNWEYYVERAESKLVLFHENKVLAVANLEDGTVDVRPLFDARLEEIRALELFWYECKEEAWL